MTWRLLLLSSVILFILAGLDACGPRPDLSGQINQTFENFKIALMGGHANEALTYIDQPSLNYLEAAISHPVSPTDPNVELDGLIRGTAERLTPEGIGPGFTLERPFQHILDKGWINPDSLDRLEIGPVSSKGDQARAEVLWQGGHTTFQLYFVRENGRWKMDLLNAVPYAELALRMDRSLHNETDQQQLQRLLQQVPSL